MSGKCFDHPSQDAVSRCRLCGNNLCSDCFDMYGVTSGEFIGSTLCFSCTEKLVEQNVSEVDKLKSKAIKELIFIIPLMIWNMLKATWYFFEGCSSMAKGNVVGGMITCFSCIFRVIWAPIKTIIDIIKKSIHVKQANAIIVNDTQSLHEMRDYFAYQQEKEKQGSNFDFNKLTEQGNELYNNTFAQIVSIKGDEIAQLELRQRIAQISANSEKISTFTTDWKPNPKK